MARTKTPLLSSPPYLVEIALRQLGSNLRTARLARNLKLEQVAEKIGTGRRAVADAEKGRPGTAVAVYMALLWTYDLLGPVAQLANPANDAVAIASLARRERARVSTAHDLDNNF